MSCRMVGTRELEGQASPASQYMPAHRAAVAPGRSRAENGSSPYASGSRLYSRRLDPEAIGLHRAARQTQAEPT